MFSSSDKRIVTIRAPRQRVAERLTVPDQIKESLVDEIDSCERIDDKTMRWVRKAVEEKGVRFRADYTVRYEYDGNGRVTWTSIGTGNMRVRGEARLTAIDDHSTHVEYSDAVECDMEVNRILAVVLRPIVERNIKAGISRYVAKVKAGLEQTPG